jgi:hypothetical protein
MHFTVDEVTALKSKTLLCNNPVILSSISIYSEFVSLTTSRQYVMIWVLLLSYTHIIRVFDLRQLFKDYFVLFKSVITAPL